MKTYILILQLLNGDGAPHPMELSREDCLTWARNVDLAVEAGHIVTDGEGNAVEFAFCRPTAEPQRAL